MLQKRTATTQAPVQKDPNNENTFLIIAIVICSCAVVFLIGAIYYVYYVKYKSINKHNKTYQLISKSARIRESDKEFKTSTEALITNSEIPESRVTTELDSVKISNQNDKVQPNLTNYPNPMPTFMKFPVESCSETILLGNTSFAEYFQFTTYNREILKWATRDCVALKRLYKTIPVEAYYQEVCITACFRHPNIAHMVGYIEEKYILLIIYHPAATLDNWNYRQKEFKRLKHIIQIIKGIFIGLLEIHKHGIVHNNINPLNIILGIRKDNICPRISDFSMAIILKDSKLSPRNEFANSNKPSIKYCCPVRYTTPYPMVSDKIAKAADLYSIGILLNEILTGRSPLL